MAQRESYRKNQCAYQNFFHCILLAEAQDPLLRPTSRSTGFAVSIDDFSTITLTLRRGKGKRPRQTRKACRIGHFVESGLEQKQTLATLNVIRG